MDYRNSYPAGSPPGIRNNNPGNIRPGDSWLGMAGTDNNFIVFTDMKWGVRAMAQSLFNSWHGGNSDLTDIITTWAPPDDNNPDDNYIAYVAGQLGIGALTPLTMDTGQLRQLVRAMANFELGDAYASYLSDEDLDAGLDLVSDNVKAYLSAVVPFVQENPTTSILAIGFLLLAGYLIFRKES